MKAIILALLLAATTTTLQAIIPPGGDIVSIWDDLDNGLWGRSINRSIRRTVYERQFRLSSTFYVSNDIGYFLTAVTINVAVVNRLEQAMRDNRSLMIGEFELSIDEAVSTLTTPVYRLVSRRTGLDTSFAFVKPPATMLRMIEAFYQNDPFNREIVVDYYRNNYVIAIYAAENIFESWHQQITLPDAMIMATLLGDRFQKMWGVHDGNALLERIMNRLPAAR
ncbi:MAG: hypothetical protein FWE37_05010 [Spirochaetaceae bacterium]|nr:hypothetical protein [Spirochaetaceae bacterium]